jgi:hypothetical protein
MKKAIGFVAMVLALAVCSVAFGQEAAPAPVAAPAVMCGVLEVPTGCTCKDAAKNELECSAGAEVAVPAGGGRIIVEDGGKTTVYVPAKPITEPPEKVVTVEKHWEWWQYALAGVGAVALGVGAYYAVDAMTTTEVHIRDK